MGRVEGFNKEDPGSNPQLGLMIEFVLGDPKGKLTTICKINSQLVCLLPVGRLICMERGILT